MKKILLSFLSVFLLLSSTVPTQAASEAECAIWICLPGGFPAGCGAAHSAFLHRIKKRMSPLPELSSCTTGPNGEKVAGSYELGQERFETCQSGYVLRTNENRYMVTKGQCFAEACAPVQKQYYEGQNYYCQSYPAVERQKQSYVKMWVNGDYLGQYWYQ